MSGTRVRQSKDLSQRIGAVFPESDPSSVTRVARANRLPAARVFEQWTVLYAYRYAKRDRESVTAAAAIRFPDKRTAGPRKRAPKRNV